MKHCFVARRYSFGSFEFLEDRTWRCCHCFWCSVGCVAMVCWLQQLCWVLTLHSALYSIISMYCNLYLYNKDFIFIVLWSSQTSEFISYIMTFEGNEIADFMKYLLTSLIKRIASKEIYYITNINIYLYIILNYLNIFIKHAMASIISISVDLKINLSALTSAMMQSCKFNFFNIKSMGIDTNFSDFGSRVSSCI